MIPSEEQKEQPRRIWTIPNLMTVMRLFFLIPIFWCLSQSMRWCAFSWALLGVITDLMDGWVARKLNQASDLGRIMDPVVDKVNVLSVTLFMGLSSAYAFPIGYFIFMAIREGLILFGGIIVIRKKKVVPESGRPGKWSAFTTGLMVLLFMVNYLPAAWILLWASLALTLWSTFFYVRIFLREMRAG